MNEAEKYFLVVAEELNISRAANRLFVSHQNVSQHIQALETKYNVKLLNRKPKLSLTDAGKALVDTLTQINILERDLVDRLNEKNTEFRGEISFGMPHPRSYILIPEIIPRYRQTYPNIYMRFTENNSKTLTEKLMRGDIDMFIGIKSNCLPQLEYEVLLSEKIYLVIPDQLLRMFYSQEYPKCIQRFRSGVHIKEFCDFPFSVNSQDNYIRSLIEAFLADCKVSLNCIFECTSQEVQLLLCQKGSLCAFSTQMHLHSIIEYNNRSERERQLHVFPVHGLQSMHEVSLVYHQERFFPPYKNHLRVVIRDILKNYDMLDHSDFFG